MEAHNRDTTTGQRGHGDLTPRPPRHRVERGCRTDHTVLL